MKKYPTVSKEQEEMTDRTNPFGFVAKPVVRAGSVHFQFL